MIKKFSSNNISKEILNNEKIDLNEFKELKFILENSKNLKIKEQKNILKYFRYLQKTEIKGWRTKESNLIILKILINSHKNPINYYALFCPSYKKGIGEYGFRTDGVGKTTETGIRNLIDIYSFTSKLGFKCAKPLAIFFDLALEQSKMILQNNELKSLEVNINNLKQKLPKNIEFKLLSEMSGDLKSELGYEGIVVDPLPIPEEIFNRVLERGRKFYQLFGWSEDQIIERTKIICSSEAIVGKFLKKELLSGILVYTPTMLERGAVYSGHELKNNPLPIIYPQK